MNDIEKTINILCATDDKYAPYCGIMLTSLFESNKNCRFEVYLLLDGLLSEKNQKKYSRLQSKYNIGLHQIVVDNSLLEDCPVNQQRNVDDHSWVSKPTYYRLLAAELLPQSVHKVLYLDGDIVINGDIRPLWETDITGKAIAGVVDCDEEGNCRRMGYDSKDGYFNAGVAIYNLDYWRENHISDVFSTYLKDENSQLLLMDQDVVNGVLHAQKCLLPRRFNFQVAFFDPLFWGSYSMESKESIIIEAKEAVVIHYVGSTKPWDYHYYGCPFNAVWNQYCKLSFWKSSRITQPKKKYIKFLIKKMLWGKTLKEERRINWTVLPENEFCYE